MGYIPGNDLGDDLGVKETKEISILIKDMKEKDVRIRDTFFALVKKKYL